MSNVHDFNPDDTDDSSLAAYNTSLTSTTRRLNTDTSERTVRGTIDSARGASTLGRSLENVDISIQHVNEFRTLLEAAEQIANAPHIDAGDAWYAEIDAAPHIRRLSQSTTHETSRPRPMTGRYSGRPHVPGEDSGSDGAFDEGELTQEDNSWLYQDDVVPHLEPSGTTGVAHGLQDTRRTAVLRLDRNEQQVLDNAREQIQSSRADVERAQYEVIAQRDGSAERSLGDVFHRMDYDVQQSERQLLDLQRQANALLQESEASARSLSMSAARRWRPSERLQDFASNTARREAQPESDASVIAAQLDRSFQTQRGLDLEHSGGPSTVRENISSTEASTRRPQGAPRDLSLALEQYRSARRALHRDEQQATATGAQARDNGVSGWLDRPDARLREEAYSVHNFVAWSRHANESTRVPDVSSTLRTSFAEATTDWGARRGQMLPRELSTRAGRRSRQVDDPMELTTGPLFNQRTRPNMFDDAEPDRRRLRELMRTLSTDRPSASHDDDQNAIEIAHDDLTRSLVQAKSVLTWLARLREERVSREEAWETATKADLHNLDLEKDASRELPMVIDDLPLPGNSSWLQPGTRWNGTQTAEATPDQAVQLSNLRRLDLESHRLRSERARVDADSRWFASQLLRSRQDRQNRSDPLVRVFNRRSRNVETMAAEAVMLENTERALSHVLERSRRHVNNQDDWEVFREATRIERCQDAVSDNTWKVSITLHSVDWIKSTITGTMSASELPGQKTARSADPSTPGVDLAMDSFFTGEIIDFHQHGLDTVASPKHDSSKDKKRKGLASDYSPGGLQTDLLYWSSLPPFRSEIEKANEVELQKNIYSARTKIASAALDRQRHADSLSSLPTSDPTPTDLATYAPLDPSTPHIIHDLSHTPIDCSLTAQQLLHIRQTTMTRLLSDTKWLNRNVGAAEYILMRWKERCFVSDGLSPNPNFKMQSRGPGLRDSSTTRVYSTVAADRDDPTDATGGVLGTWGLTISGFYYVSLNRRTGSIEGLYYDAGAGPFQRLKMEVASSARDSSCTSEDQNGRSEGVDLPMTDSSNMFDVFPRKQHQQGQKQEEADSGGLSEHDADTTSSSNKKDPSGGQDYHISRKESGGKQVHLSSSSSMLNPWPHITRTRICGGLRSSFGVVEFR